MATSLTSDKAAAGDQVNYWQNRWERNETQWHIDEVNPWLLKFHDRFIPNNPQSNNDKKVFVPLCGKTRDLDYLLNIGLNVFAVEGVQQPILELEAEHMFGLEFKENESIYESPSGHLRIYYGDLFTCPIEKWGPFDYIWDRGSFIAIDYDSRRKYIEMMKRSVKTCGKYRDFQYLLAAVNYDKNLFEGPPRCVDENDMKEYFGDWTNAEILNNTKLPDDSALRSVIGMSATELPVDDMVYLLTRKDS